MEQDFLCDREVFRDLELENMIQDFCDESQLRLDLVSGFEASQRLVFGRTK